MDCKKPILFSCLCIAGLAEVFTQSALPVVQCLSFKKETFNIINYASKADGATVNTKPITTAINTCNKKTQFEFGANEASLIN